MMIAPALLVLLLSYAAGPTPAPHDPHPAPESVRDVVEAMVERYEGEWYRDLTFVQTTSFYGADETVSRTEIWYESITLPGMLRVDVAPVEGRRSFIFRNDTVHRFAGGAHQGSQAGPHPLLLMGFDVYALSVEQTLAKLDILGVDAAVMHESTWQGRPVYVLGAEEGDLTSHQFWIDQERLVFVRQLQGPREVQFNNYERLGGGWIAPEVVFFNDGRRTLLEEYAEVRIDLAHDPEAFRADGGVRPAWVPSGG